MKRILLSVSVMLIAGIANAQTVTNTYFLNTQAAVNRSTEVLRVSTTLNDSTLRASLDIVANSGFLTVLNKDATVQRTPNKRGQAITLSGVFSIATYYNIKAIVVECRAKAEAARQNKASFSVTVEAPKVLNSIENRINIQVDENSKITCQ